MGKARAVSLEARVMILQYIYVGPHLNIGPMVDKACEGVIVKGNATLGGVLASRMVRHATHGATRTIHSARTVVGLVWK